LQFQLPRQYREQLQGKDLSDMVDNWINTQILYQQGLKKGLDKDPEVAAVVKLRQGDAIARRYVESEILDKTTVTPAQIDSAYNADKDKYKIDKDRLRAGHIMLGSKEEAEGVYTRLKKGDDFAKLAADYSIDKQSASSGGDLGFFTADQIDTAFFAAASKLKVGEFSEPVKTAYGFHIIKLLERQPAGSAPDMAEVRSKISDDLTAAIQNAAYASFVDSLRRNAKIENFINSNSAVPGDTTSSVPGVK
jgi:parvulin-like peptidyl-prolyl isomerase